MKKKAAAFVAILLLLTGCSMSAGIDTIIAPPKLSRQQERIYNALIGYTGTNISLKYPKSGDYLSAFIIADIDSDEEDEAIVFYEKNTVSAEDNSLRLNVLDCIDSQWKSVYDHAADGNEVEKVVITELGDNDRINIIVGYSLINQSEKVVSIYHYADEILHTTFENNYYSLFEAEDLNGDDTKELFIALNQSASREAAAEVFHLNENGEYFRSTISLDESYTDYQKMTCGSLGDGSTGIYLDAVTGSGTIVTTVLTVDSENVLSRLFYPDADNEETLRPLAYTCYDADGDGEIEIPIPYLFPGYSEDDSEKLNYTKWYGISDGKLYVKAIGYQSITNGYILMFPDEWIGNVTAEADTERSRITFREISGTDESSRLMTIQSISGNDTEGIRTYTEQGYEVFHSREDKLFLVWINKENELTQPAEELMFRIKFFE